MITTILAKSCGGMRRYCGVIGRRGTRNDGGGGAVGARGAGRWRGAGCGAMRQGGGARPDNRHRSTIDTHSGDSGGFQQVISPPPR